MKRTKPTKRVRTVLYLPPSIYAALQKAADTEYLKVSQKGTQIITHALK